MSNELLVESRADGVRVLTLNRPEKRNALNATLVEGLLAALASFSTDNATRAVLLTGSGNTFCAGLDLAELAADAGHPQVLTRAKQLARLLYRLDTFDLPVIARINGDAHGGGVGLIACCDSAIAVENARFSFAEVRLGLVPAVILPYAITRLGQGPARRLILTGADFHAADAEQTGLIQARSTADALDHAVGTEIARLLAGAPRAQRAAKGLLAAWAHDDLAFPEDLSEVFADIARSEEAREGIAAFLAKRPPSWRK